MVLLSLGGGASVQADIQFDCYVDETCPYHATCYGDVAGQTGCSVQCYVFVGNGYVANAGSANCAGGGGGGPKPRHPTS